MIAELSKSKYLHKFDGVFVSSRALGVVTDTSDNAMSELLKCASSVLAVESAKYITTVTKQQKADLVIKLNTHATT